MGKQGYDKRAALANALNTSGVAKVPPPKKEEPKPAPTPSKGQGKRRQTEPDEPQKTKKDIEAEQRQLLEDNDRKREQFYKDEAAKKVQDKKGAESSVTYVEDKDTRKPKAVADISDFWKSDLGFLPFLPDDNVGPMVEAAEDDLDPQERLEYLQMFDEQLAQLLRLKFHVFWSQMIYDDKVRRTLDSYLRFCLRSHDTSLAQADGGGGGSPSNAGAGAGQNLIAEEEQKVAREISRRVLAVFVRLSRPQESAHEFISDGKFAQVIYEHSLFDIPKLIDLCAIYGDSNRNTVTRIVHSVFSHQPLYKDDFESVIKHMLGSLHQCCEPLQEAAGRKTGKPNGSAALSVDECVAFLPDMLSCFNAIFCFFPEECVEKVVAGRLSVDAGGGGEDGGKSATPLADLMVLLHDAISALQQLDDGSSEHATVLRTTVVLLSRLLGLVLGFRMAPRRGATAFEELLDWLREHDEHGSLLGDLGKHGLESCAMEWLASGLVDDAQLDFLEQLCGVPVLPAGERLRGRATAAARRSRSAAASGGGAGAQAPGAGGAASSSAGAGAAAKPADPSASDRAKMREVREVVGGDYGEGFLLQCLLHFGGSVPAVVGAIFDCSLPPHIAALPQGATLAEAFNQVSAAASRCDAAGGAGGAGGGMSAEDKRRVLGQASRQADEAKAASAADEAAAASSSSAAPGAGAAGRGDSLDAYYELETYDDDFDDSVPMPSGVRVGAANESDSNEDGDSNADSDDDPRWRDGGGKGKGGYGGYGKGKGRGRGPVQGQTFQARRKEENKARVGNHNRRDGAMRKMMRGMT